MSENKIENSYGSQMNEDLKEYMENINNIESSNDKYNLNSFEKEVNELDEKYSNDNYNVKKEQGDLIEIIVSAITRYLDINKEIQDYVEAIKKEYAELQDIVDKEVKDLDDIALSEEEIGKIRDDYLSKKITKSEAIAKLRKNIEEVRKQIQELKEQIDQEKRELQFASIAGITREECQKLFSKESMKEIIETVLSIKNTIDLEGTRSTIAKMIAKAEKKNPLDNVQILSSSDEKFEQQEPSRPIKIAEDSLGNITINITITINREPVKVAGKAQVPDNPGKAPADMINKNEENKAGNNNMAKEELEDNWKFTDKDGKDITDEIISKKSEEKPKKKTTSNDAFGVYKKYSNRYDALADEIKDIEKQLESSDEKDADLQKLLDKKKTKLKELAEKMKAKLIEARDLLEEEKATLSREEINKIHVGKDPQGKMKLINDALEPKHGTLDGNITTYALRGSNGLAASFTDESATSVAQISKKHSFENFEEEPGLENRTGGSAGDSGDRDDTGTGDNGDVTIDDSPRFPSEPERIAIPAYAESVHEHDNDVENKPEERGFRDRITIFRDLDNDKLYVRKAVFTRFFGLDENIEQVRINGALCYEITEEEANYLESNQDNELSPYFIQYIEVQLGKSKKLTPTGGLGGNGEGLNNDTPILPSGPSRIAIPAYAESVHKHDGDDSLENNQRPGPNPPTTTGDNGNNGGDDGNNGNNENGDDSLENNQRPWPNPSHPTGDNGNNSGNDGGDDGNNENNENGDDSLENNQRPEPNPSHPTGDNGNNGGNDDHGDDDENDKQDEDDKDNDNERGVKDRVTIFRDLDNDGKLYIRKAAFTRFFGLEQNIEQVLIDGVVCYAITEEEEKYLLDNQDNELSPYFVVYKDVHLKEKKPQVEEETVVIFKAVDDNDQLYATKEVHDKFGLTTEGDPIEIQGKQCYKVSPEKNKIINDKARQSENPKINVIYKPVYIKKKQEQPKVEIHYQEVIRKLTKDLDIKAKDGKRYRASNIKAAQSFKDELKSGNYLYNILHFAPAVVKAGITFFRKLASKILLTKRGRDVTKEINARLNGESENKECNLTDEDLEVLWQHYKGRNLRSDMNNQINPIILAKLREYGLRKVEALNNEIKQHYLAVIAATDEIEKLKEEIANTKNEKKKAELQNKLRELYKFAAESVRIIQDRRKKADDLLSNGVHGIEEDFKAVESKMNYIGFRFSKQNDFDNELQDRLADAGKRINTAKAYGDDEGLVEAFIDYEKIYYEETEVKNSIVGKRSTGNKWYQPIAEAMDYRDDPFIRDLFTTIATVSAAVSIANGLITHMQKDQQFQQQVNNDINSTNAANQQNHSSVQHEVQNIKAQRQAEIQGLQGQMNKDVRDAFNTGERGILDKSDWSFNDSYHADDAILHAQAQGLYESAQNQIQSVVSQLQSGAITETQAIEMLAKAEANLSTTVNNALQPLYNASKAYAKGHPFELDATLAPSDWFANHPNAFVDFGNAIIAVNKSADALSLLSPSFMQTIGSLPSDLATTLAAGISSLALVKNVQTTMKNKTNGKNINHKNGELGEMFREHIIDRGEEEERSHTK